MKSVIIKGLRKATTVFLSTIIDGKAPCIMESLGNDEYGLSVVDDEAAMLMAACQASTAQILTAFRST